MRVLLVDDDELFTRALMVDLVREEVDVVGVAHDGWTGIELALELEPDVVVMDVQMPGLDGLTATELLRERGSEATVVALSGGSDLRDAALKGDLVASFVSKSTPVHELAAILRDLVPLSRTLGR